MIKKIILLIIINLLTANPLSPVQFEIPWGISRTDLISRFKLENYSIFKPEEKPNYSNKIIDFFNSMDSDQKVRIVILRTGSKPEIDYCFFNEKLYSISEEWGYIDRNKAFDLLKTINEKYNDTTTQEKTSNIIYSFKKDTTKVLLVKKVIDEKSVQMRIFYYSVNLFSMLMSE